jgi:single-stranded DNA-binding protein
MERTKLTDNKVTVTGTVSSDLEYSHEILGEKFYTFSVTVRRKSGTEDSIPVMVSDRMDWFDCIKELSRIQVCGSLRTHNKHHGSGHHLILSVFADAISFPSDEAEDQNVIEMVGYICKKKDSRQTPLGRIIADMILAVNRPYGKSDYLPCIAWGRNATYCDKLATGTKLSCRGRIQSRIYQKEGVDKTAYEVSLYYVEPLY